MFDLIDDLSADKWEDKGTPPDNWEELGKLNFVCLVSYLVQ